MQQFVTINEKQQHYAVDMRYITIDTSQERTFRFWCIRFITLAFIISTIQLTLVLLFPPIYNHFTNERPTEKDDIFIAIKTTEKFHRNRVQLLLDTWIGQVKDQVGSFCVPTPSDHHFYFIFL